MAKKRLKKKRQKQKVVAKLQSKGYSEKEIKKLPKQEVKKVEAQVRANDRQKLRRQQNTTFIRKNNLNESYKYEGKEYKGIGSMRDLSPEVLKQFAEVQKRRDRDRKRQERYIKTITDAGYSREFAEKYKNKSLKFVEEVAFKGDRTVYTSKQYLSIAWSDVTNESQWTMALHQYDDLSTKEMIAKIHETYRLAKQNKAFNKQGKIEKGDSSGFMGVAKISISNSPSNIKIKTFNARNRGYNKGMVTEDTQLLSTNQFTVRGYANMMLSVMTRTKPALIQEYYHELENFAYNNLPEIHKEIFR